MIRLPKTDEALLKECSWEAYRSSGAGGQHVNKTDSAVRLTHNPTGLTVTSQKERSQLLNKKACLVKLRKKVEALNYVQKTRIPTKVPRSAKEKNKTAKTKHSEKKQLRQKFRE